jgi:hypothetical protein
MITILLGVQINHYSSNKRLVINFISIDLLNFFSFYQRFFDKLRNEVDIYFTEQEKNEANDDVWLEIIEKIKSFESSTYNQLPSNINTMKSQMK